MSRKDLAVAMGVTHGTVGRWEREERTPQAYHRALLAMLLGRAEEQLGFPPYAARTPKGYRGQGLRPVRLERGLTAAELADRVGVPPHTIYNWERGAAWIPPERIAPVAAALDLTQGALTPRLENPPATFSALSPRPSGQLARLRIAAGLSQVQAARLLLCSRSSLRAYERGTPPPLAVGRRMARVFGVSVGRIAAATGMACPRELFPDTWRHSDLPLILRALRAWTGRTQAHLAKDLGVSTAAVRNWENGRHKPMGRARRRIEALYGIPDGSLLRGF